jgi:hypothetical protein
MKDGMDHHLGVKVFVLSPLLLICCITIFTLMKVRIWFRQIKGTMAVLELRTVKKEHETFWNCVRFRVLFKNTVSYWECIASVIAEWMNEHGALLDWYCLTKTKILREAHLFAILSTTDPKWVGLEWKPVLLDDLCSQVK